MTTNVQSPPGNIIPSRSGLVSIGLGALLMIGMLIVLQVFGAANAASAEAAQLAARDKAAGLAIPTSLEQVVVQPAQVQPLSVEDQLRAAVERANRAFIEARSQASAGPLQGIAAGSWLTEEQNYLAGLRSRSQTERWKLVRLEYLLVQPQGATAGFVCTREVWEVTTIGPNNATGPTRTYTFQEGYYLSKPGTDWVVTRIDIG
jgi:hypothetical protein